MSARSEVMEEEGAYANSPSSVEFDYGRNGDPRGRWFGQVCAQLARESYTYRNAAVAGLR